MSIWRKHMYLLFTHIPFLMAEKRRIIFLEESFFFFAEIKCKQFL